MSDVFLSYSSQDRAQVIPLVAAIEQRGWTVWWDRKIDAGAAFDREIETALDEAKCVIVVWSAHSVASDWVRNEASEGLSRGVLVPVIIGDVRPPLAFRLTQNINLDDAPASLEALFNAIQRLCPKSQPVGHDPSAPVDLAREDDFRLGGLLVSPSACRVKAGGQEQRLEPRVMEVLVALARGAGHTVTRDQLISACWGGRVVSDDAVTRVVAQVRNLARSFEPAPFVLDTVPKVGFRLTPREAVADAAAEPAAIGAKPAAGPRPKPASRRMTWRTGALAAGLVAVLAVGAVVAWRMMTPGFSRPAWQNGHVEVMAFDTQGPEPALKKIAAEQSETLVRVLAGAGLQVAEQPSPRDNGGGDAELRVTGVVEQDNADYVINPQILDRKTGVVLWTDRFKRTAAEQAQSPAEVANSIAAVLHCALADRAPARTFVSTEAFSLYLNACAGVFVDGGSHARMLSVTRRLVKVAPKFAGAHAMHAIAAAFMGMASRHDPAEALALHDEAKAAAELALKLDQNTPKAYSALALNEGVFSDAPSVNRVLVEQYLLKALKLDPDLPPARNEYATLLRATGRTREALEVMRTANATHDPRFGGDPREALMLAAAGDLPSAYDALDRLETFTRMSQDSMRWTIAFWWEDPKTALAKVKTLAAPRTAKGQLDCLVQFLTELEARKAAKTRGLPSTCATADGNWRVRMLAREGDVDGAFALLKPPLPGGPMVLYYPEMKSVRRDPRFWPLAKSLGLTDYWRKSGHWPDFCAEPDLPYDCRKVVASLAP